MTTLLIWLYGVSILVTFEYEAAVQTTEINDPETLDIHDLTIYSGSLLTLLESCRTTSDLIEEIKEELRKQL